MRGVTDHVEVTPRSLWSRGGCIFDPGSDGPPRARDRRRRHGLCSFAAV